MSTTRRTVLAGAAAASATAASVAAAQPSSSASEPTRSQQRLTAAQSFVALPRVAVPVVGRFRPEGTLVAEVCLDIPDASLRARAPGMMPRLRDSLRQALTTYVSVHLRPGGAPDADRIVVMMQSAVERTFGQAGARLLLVDLVLQRV